MELENNPALQDLKTAIYKVDRTAQDILDDVVAKSTPYRSNPGGKMIGANKFITARHVSPVLEYLDFERLTPEYNLANRKAKYVQDHKSELGGEENAAKAFDEQVESEALNSQIGTLIHEGVNVWLEKGKSSSEFSAYKDKIKQTLTKDDYALSKEVCKNSTTIQYTETDKIVKKILDQVEATMRWINSTYPSSSSDPTKKRVKIYSEMPIVLHKKEGINLDCYDGDTVKKYDGIIGVADLVVVTEDGVVHIVDYKVSSRPYSEWYQAKINEVEYQLALYRAMLSSYGIDGSKITLEIKPMILPKGNIAGLKDSASEDLLKSYGTSRPSRVSWTTGEFTDKLRRLGIGPKLSFPKTEVKDFELKIQQDYERILGYHKDPKQLEKSDFINNSKWLQPYIDTSTGKSGYRFYNKITNKWVFNEDKNEFTKEGGLLDEYIKELASSKLETLTTIIKEIKKYKESDTKDRSFLRSEHNPDKKRLLEHYLGKYISPDWQLVEDAPEELADHGIILFQKQTTNGIAMDMVVLTDIDLELRVPINEQQTVLGKFYTDTEVKTLPITPLDATYKNIKAIEAYSILNTLMNNYPDQFSEVQLGSLILLNPNGSARADATIDIRTLQDNFNVLCKAAQGVQVANVKTQEPYEYFMSELETILHDCKEDTALKQLLSNIDKSAVSIVEKRTQIEALLRKMRKIYPELSGWNDVQSSRNLDFSNQKQLVYWVLSQMYNYLSGIEISYDGRISKWGLSLDEVFQLFGIFRYGAISKTTKSGNKTVGLGGGLEITSPRTSPSNTIRQLIAYYDLMYSSVRKEYLEQNNYVHNICSEYIKKKKSVIGQVLSSANTSMWEDLLLHDKDNKLIGDLILKDPYDTHSNLSETDKDFLKKILWEINKYRLPGISDDDLKRHYEGANKAKIDSIASVVEAKVSGSYYELPLTRAESFQKFINIGKSGFDKWKQAKLEELRDNFDQRRLHNERRKQLKNADYTEMYNEYNITAQERMDLISSVDNPYNFSFDLEFLASDIAFQTIRKKYFDSALMLTETVAMALHVMSQEQNVDVSNELSAIADHRKINITNESLLEEDQEDMAKGASILKKINSFMLLALRPAQFVKELTFGAFTNFSRAWALKYGSNQLSYEAVAKATRLIWGQSLKQKGNVLLGNGTLSDFTLCEKINHLYGIANMDLNRLTQNTVSSGKGIFNNLSRSFYIANSAPDYYNRLTLFIAKMIVDGCFDAHSLDKNGKLIYDWRKDKRFSELAKYGLNSTGKHSEKYNEQKALYVAMCKDFERAGEQLITWNNTTQQYEYGDITQAYTSDQRASIKEVSDMAYGFYDHETKSLLNHKFFGLIFLQFQTFLSAKINLWFKAPSKRGENTAQGKLVKKVRDGQVMYQRIITDTTGNIIRQEEVPENELTEEERGKVLPIMEWQGDYVEGLVYSIGSLIHDVCCMDWKAVSSNKYRLANVKLAMHDLALGLLLFYILKLIFSEGTEKMQRVEPTKRILLRALNDLSPAAITQLSFTPSFIQTQVNMKNDIIKLLSDGDAEMIDTLTRHFGATKDFIWDEE